MPFIHIQSLPFESPIDIEAVLGAISREFALQTGIGIEHVFVTWRFFEPGHYAAAGKPESIQSQNSHPVLVTLYAPDFNSPQTIEGMMASIATSVAIMCPFIETIFLSITGWPAQAGCLIGGR